MIIITSMFNEKKLFAVRASTLRGQYLADLDLRDANFVTGDLTHTSFARSDLRGASFYGADLRGACFLDADLRGASFKNANLLGAEFKHAKVYGVKWPAPTMVLLADWDAVSYILCKKLMRYDASNHSDPKLFLKWAKGGECPYADMDFQRSATFRQCRSHISKSFLRTKVETAYNLMQMLLREQCICGEEG